MENLAIGMRCQDVHTSLGEIDPNSSALAKVSDTRLIGMSASLASAIRGQDIVHDGRALAEIAAEQLDVSPYAFDKVVRTLENMGWVNQVVRKGDHVLSFNETIPLHQNLYDGLGVAWAETEPDEFEQSFVSIVDRLTRGPIPEEALATDIGFDKKDHDKLLQLAFDADIVKRLATSDGTILYSPFFFFENADTLPEVMLAHGTAQFQDEFERVRSYQGLPISIESTPVLFDAVGRGLIMAPTVEDPHNTPRSFACIPYAVDKSFLGVRREVLNRALAVLACIRCGENFGGATSIARPLAVLDTLLNDDRDNMLGAHSSNRRQYQLLYNNNIVDFIVSGDWVRPQLRKTEDNIAAVRLARDLIAFGETMHDRSKGAEAARKLLMNSSRYESPIETVHRSRSRVRRPDEELRSLFQAIMGHTAL